MVVPIGVGIVFIAVFFIAGIRIVPQSQSYVIERLGKYSATWGSGIHILIPFIDKISKRVSLKEQVFDFPPQPVITRDNVTMQIDTVVYFQVMDSKLYTYGVEDPINAIENLTATTLRNVIGDLELDSTLTSRDTINIKMRAVLDEASDPWGIKVNRVELKNILPPREIQDAMEKQMKAERERRESILIAEGQKESAILVAQGQKEAEILRAEGEKISTILQAEAEKETLMRKAEGEANAILAVQSAKAEGIKMLNQAQPSKEVLALKGMETFEALGNGNATKLIIPSDLHNVVSLASIFQETK